MFYKPSNDNICEEHQNEKARADVQRLQSQLEYIAIMTGNDVMLTDEQEDNHNV